MSLIVTNSNEKTCTQRYGIKATDSQRIIHSKAKADLRDQDHASVHSFRQRYFYPEMVDFRGDI